MPKIPEIPSGFPVVEAKVYPKARLTAIDEVPVTEGKWAGKMGSWFRYIILDDPEWGNAPVSEYIILPYTTSWEILSGEDLRKCFRFRDLATILYGGVFPKDVDWADFKSAVTGTEWKIEVANRAYQGVTKSTVVAVMPVEEMPF